MIEYFSEIDWTAEGNSKSVAVKRKGKGKKANGSSREEASSMTAGELLKAVLHGLIKCLRDPALPVQAASACSLR